jgi:ferredoxin
MKTLTFEPINQTMAVPTESSLLQALLAKQIDVPMACGGKGMCATCHVYVKKGMDKVTPPTQRESRTLAIISGTDARSRLACQCRVLGEGVVVELPEGMYVERIEDLFQYIGSRAERNILHPINGNTLIAQGKIVTRSRLEELKKLNTEVADIKNAVD